jgi:putative aldouronate transport system substrate-binding protein
MVSGGNPGSAPAYVPYTGVEADLPSGARGVPAGFFHYPANPPTFMTGSVGNGGGVTVMMESASVSVPRSSNQWWQALEKAWDVKLTFNYVLAGKYLTKFQTAVAGGELGDFTQIPNGGYPGAVVPHLPDVLDRMFTDLTPYLGGDAIKEYPGLASIPSDTWTKVATVNGKIWGIPQPRPMASPIVSYRQSVFDKAGASSDLSDGNDFVALFKALTDVKAGCYAMGQVPSDWLVPLVLQMMGAPNNWAVDGGKFTNAYETDQMVDALTEVAKLWKAGYIHPDAYLGDDWVTKFEGGGIGVYSQHFPGWTTYATALPDDTIGALRLPKWEGGGPSAQYLTVPGYSDPVGLKKISDDNRIAELLRIANYMAAPFGTKEYLLVNYGVAGDTYTLDGTDPVQTKSWTPQHVVPSYIGSQASNALYVSGNDTVVTAEHTFLADVMPTAVDDPSLGLYSATESTKGATADKTLHGIQDDIIQGRKAVSAWKSAVVSWRSSAGDEIRKEYEEAYAASH